MLVRDLFLPEARANRTQFQSILNDPSVLMGFECEMMLVGHHETVDPDQLSFEHLVPLLDDRDVAQVERAAADWSRENDMDDEPDIDQFIATEFGSNRAMMDSYGFKPIHGETEDGLLYATSEPDQQQTYEQAADTLRQRLGIEWVEVHDTYHGEGGKEEKMLDTWYIEPDESISKLDPSRVPAEVVSAVYPVGESLDKLDATFRFMAAENAETDDTTGLHINLSIDGKTEDDYDYLKMLLMFDENRVAAMFGRLGNNNTKTLRDKLRDILAKMLKRDPMSLSARTILDSNRLGEVLFTLRLLSQRLRGYFDKYHAVLNRENGVFEFRGMGGQGYEQRFTDVRQQVVNMAYLLKLGANDKLEVQTYLTKLFLMLDGGKFADAEPGAGKHQPVLPALLSAFGRLANAHTAYLAEHEPARFVAEIGAYMALRGLRLDRTQALQLRRFVLTQKIVPAQVEAESRDDNCFNALAALLGWPERGGVESPWGQDDDTPVLSDIVPSRTLPAH